MNTYKTLSSLVIASCFTLSALAQTTTATTQTVIKAEEDFNKLVSRKGIKDAFLTVADPEGIVFKPEAVNITDFYSKIDKQPGTLTWHTKFARTSASGDLAVTAGPYVYQNGKTDEDKVFGDCVSVWRMSTDNKLKLLINLGIQHPENEKEELTDIKEPQPVHAAPSKDPFNGKNVIMNTDKLFNTTLQKSTLAAYKIFFEPEAHYLFPGFNPMVGQDQTLHFLESQAVTISAQTVNAGRSSSGDLAYSYGRARIKKGAIVSNYNYVRIWEIDAKHQWNVLLEVFSAIEAE
ncbi:hypothetical protein HH214_05505 [Mucilaginibacter robiniae]|uniref:Nuclear transport factor 2 family protein n=1 Tax=Mucilaginibacter robiniae TaxID=2728022 RepID=A0A7L5E1E2_9SPHI|nr:hypothetical protein [Mucilaginibacter robiniae]QJD95364.1 hypothetical protein HH214_05505 [Mucilaginibacter robiniae]